jgi:DNA polymerase III alpha subunit (gram-positive type)
VRVSLLVIVATIIASCYTGFSPVRAQCASQNSAFQAGERIEYDLYFNWKFIWVKAGKATLSVKETLYQGEPAYKMDLLSVSNKRADFFFKMRDTITSIITPQMEPLYFRKAAEEGKRYTIDDVSFSYKNGVCYINQKRTHRDGKGVETKHEDSRCVYDMLSILAKARSFDAAQYKTGEKINFLMTTGRRVEEQTLIYRGKKRITDENNVSYSCLIFSLVEYVKKMEKEIITFYVTDDKNHLPIRLDLNLNFGSAKAFLNKVSGHRYPLTSIVR